MLLSVLLTLRTAAATDNPPTTNIWGLPEMLHIDWRRLGDLPIGVEDNSGGFLDDETLVCGFGLGCEAGSRGFLANCSSSRDKACWSRPGALLNVNTYHGDPHHGAWFSRMYVANTSDARTSQQWSELPLPPLSPRQGTCGATDPKTGSFFVGGGWSEWGPFPCGHTDVARLQRSPTGEYSWTSLPDLPHPVVFGAMSVVNGHVFVFGADRYAFPKPPHPTPACGSFPPMLYELADPNNLAAGWLSHSFPSGKAGRVSQVGGAMASSGTHLILIGGGNEEEYSTGGNWRFDLMTKKWDRLADSPVAQIFGFGGHNNAIFLNRYMLLVGGCEIWNWRKGAAPKDRAQCFTGSPGFGTCGCPCTTTTTTTTNRNVSAIQAGTCGVPLNDSSLPMVYGNGLFVFDLQTQTFGESHRSIAASHLLGRSLLWR